MRPGREAAYCASIQANASTLNCASSPKRRQLLPPNESARSAERSVEMMRERAIDARSSSNHCISRDRALLNLNANGNATAVPTSNTMIFGVISK